jgi:hypothetical protein
MGDGLFRGYRIDQRTGGPINPRDWPFVVADHQCNTSDVLSAPHEPKEPTAIPSPCIGKGGDAEHVFYTRLVNDLAIYGVGLAKRDRTLARLEKLLGEYRKQPATFACTLVPPRAAGTPRSGCRAT